MKNALILFLWLTSWMSFSQVEQENQENMKKYLLHGKFTAITGQAEELANILIEASKLVSTAEGCILYVVSIDENDQDSVYVTEVWDSKTDHDNSLKIEGVRELIQKAMPLLAEQPRKGQELQILDGIGL